MVHWKVAWHDPVDLHCSVDLVYAAADELQRHGLHYEHLNISLLDLAVFSESLKGQASLVFSTVKEELEEGQNAHLLVQVCHLFHNGWEAWDEVLVTLDGFGELRDLSFAKGH